MQCLLFEDLSQPVLPSPVRYQHFRRPFSANKPLWSQSIRIYWEFTLSERWLRIIFRLFGSLWNKTALAKSFWEERTVLAQVRSADVLDLPTNFILRHLHAFASFKFQGWTPRPPPSKNKKQKTTQSHFLAIYFFATMIAAGTAALWTPKSPVVLLLFV